MIKNAKKLEAYMRRIIRKAHRLNQQGDFSLDDVAYEFRKYLIAPKVMP